MLDFLKIRKSPSDLDAHLRGLATQIEEKKQRREYLLESPLSREEFADKLCNYLDEESTQCSVRFARNVAGLIVKPADVPINKHFDLLSALNVLKPGNMGAESGRVTQANIGWLLGNILKSRVCEEIMVMADYPEPGPPLAERRPELASLEKEITALQAEENKLRQDAEVAGVTINRFAPKPPVPKQGNWNKNLGGKPLAKGTRD